MSTTAPTTSWPQAEQLAVRRLGACQVRSPVQQGRGPWVDDSDRVLLASTVSGVEPFIDDRRALPSFELAGPRREIYFEPGALTAAVVTCGGLCPGLNNVIRAIVLELTYAYGVRRILGFRYGYAGLNPARGLHPVTLTPESVEGLHEHGGTLLGSSRGPQDIGVMVAALETLGVQLLFVVGGDGGLRGAAAIADAIERRGRPIAVVGVPKTIDNDLLWTSQSFGFSTAVEATRPVVLAAHAEARGAWDGIGLVKLMGRHSGFIAAHATLACNDVNFCLVPEVAFELEGEHGLLGVLERRLRHKHHAVVVVAEGAGQDLMADEDGVQHDASGNVKLKDVGLHLRDVIGAHFRRLRWDAPLRYIDPSYTIRSLPANAVDSQLCLVLGQYAVHAGMAGRTNLVVGTWNQRFTHVPIPLAVAGRKQIEPCGELWQRVIEATGQPAMTAAAHAVPA